MLILGQKYRFTQLELNRLEKQFKTINSIVYENKNSKDVIEEIESILQNDKSGTIVLNTKVKVGDEIIKYLTNLRYNENYQNIQIISIEHFLEKYLYKCYIPESNDDLHYLDDIKPFNLWQKTQKRVIDLIGAFCLLLIFLILKPFVKKKIGEQSLGSLYFKQLRVGLNNKEFECIKFRTMHEHDSDKDIRTATKEDDRKFPFGDFMRKIRIDEIPQFINILKGEMSLIGPRAEWSQLVKDYERQIPYYNQRHTIKPGITGWAQVMFVEGRAKEDTKQKLMYDMYYIKYWNIWLELKIILKTFLVVLNKSGI